MLRATISSLFDRVYENAACVPIFFRIYFYDGEWIYRIEQNCVRVRARVLQNQPKMVAQQL